MCVLREGEISGRWCDVVFIWSLLYMFFFLNNFLLWIIYNIFLFTYYISKGENYYVFVFFLFFLFVLCVFFIFPFLYLNWVFFYFIAENF